MLGIDRYSPEFFESIEAFRAAHERNLKLLIGHTIQKSWAMWSKVNGKWFPDGPVILLVNGRQFELSAFQFGFAMTVDAIDRSKPLRWYVGEDGTDGFDLYWNENAPNLLERSSGKVITAVDLFESRIIVGDTESWNFDGVGFRLDETCLAIYNNLDRLGIASGPQASKDFLIPPL